MEYALSDDDSSEAYQARLRPCWRLTMELKPGMVLAMPVSASSGGYATMSLSAGIALAEETIAQLVAKSVECVAVVNTDPFSEGVYAQLVQSYEARLRQIFDASPNAYCQDLLDAMLQRGPMPC
jgi:hypothetical protein